MTEEKQIDEMARIISEYDECGNCKVCKYHNCCSSEYHATNLYNAGYRKQSDDLVSIETVKKWLYAIAINNVGCVLDGDFSVYIEEIVSRLDGLKRFAEEMKGGE